MESGFHTTGNPVGSPENSRHYLRNAVDMGFGKTQMTAASETIRGYYTMLRQAGATARAMLVSAAAAIDSISVKILRN